MRLEGILSEIRSSAPRGKALVTGEKLCHLSYLDMIMKAHLAKGLADPRPERSAKELLKTGVPLDRVTPHSWSCTKQVPQRDDDQPSDYCPPVCVDDNNDDVGGADSEKPEDDPFCPGDATTPVRDEVLRDYLHMHADAGIGVPGVAQKASFIRKQNSRALLVEDAGDVPDSRKYQHRMACWEFHPGLCATMDSSIYDQSLLLARSFERCLGKHMLYRYFKVSTSSGESRYYYLARCRSRRLHMQATHCVIGVSFFLIRLRFLTLPAHTSPPSFGKTRSTYLVNQPSPLKRKG